MLLTIAASDPQFVTHKTTRTIFAVVVGSVTNMKNITMPTMDNANVAMLFLTVMVFT